MLARETKIYKDAFNLTKTMFEITRNFRTEYRSTIARRLEDGAAELASKIVEANLCEPKSDERQRVLGHDFVVVYFSTSSVIPQNDNSRSLGFSIRPVI